ncbi:hypothetical protein [Roseospirillum parvum]|uniref:Uncharacterized protein n=1 Tax=Roseospirillum parvum TaxID=83401 RepID=A0A1G7YJV0_9PROT|nr:hypothetical protein [Roseospirillum parvum]SDG96811.1 hypothetical protein SAMN05421742_103329 [Roseospirillum parvum]
MDHSPGTTFLGRVADAAPASVLPQQRLLLELLSMSGDIAVAVRPGESLMWRTLDECRAAGWIELVEINPEWVRASITAAGRLIART